MMDAVIRKSNPWSDEALLFPSNSICNDLFQSSSIC